MELERPLLIPRRWREVLLRLKQGGFTEAIIAGGALRDLLHGREIKDIDIWVISRGSDTKLALDMALGISTTELGEAESEYENTTKGIEDIYEFSDGGAWKFQIMAMKAEHADTFTYDTVSRFDIGLCRVWSDDGTSIQADHFYRADSVAKELTIVYAPTADALTRSLDRVERLMKKYADFKPGHHVTPPQEAF